MDTSKLFRISLIAYIILCIGIVIAGFFSSYLLPETLQQYLNAEVEEEISFPQVILIVVAIASLFLFIASLIGLFRWKSWGRTLFLASIIIAYCIAPFTGPQITSGIGYLLGDLCATIGGVIIALSYFSPVAQRFDSKTN